MRDELRNSPWHPTWNTTYSHTSWNFIALLINTEHRMAWVGRDGEDQLVPPLAMGRVANCWIKHWVRLAKAPSSLTLTSHLLVATKAEDWGGTSPLHQI